MEEITMKMTDCGKHFETKEIFRTRDTLINWAREVGKKHNVFITIMRSKQGDRKGHGKVYLGCERGGRYRKTAKAKEHDDTKKCDCPFMLKGAELRGGGWVVRVLEGTHNHELVTPEHGRALGAKLTRSQLELTSILLKCEMKPKEILERIKEVDPDNMSTVKHIYNARQKLKRQHVECEGQMQEDVGEGEGVDVGDGERMVDVEEGDIEDFDDGDEDKLLKSYFDTILQKPREVKKRVIGLFGKMVLSEWETPKDLPVHWREDCWMQGSSKRSEYRERMDSNGGQSMPAPATGPSSSTCNTSSFEFPFSDDMPSFIVPFIENWVDVAADGNCGFRAIAEVVYSDEERWPQVRRDLFLELERKRDLYANLFGGSARIKEAMNSLQHWQGPAPASKRLNMLDLGFVVATRYNAVCVCLTTQLPASYMPLIAVDGMSAPKRVITIGFLKSREHYIAVRMVEDFPMPKILTLWYSSHHESVKGWETIFTPRMQRWSFLC